MHLMLQMENNIRLKWIAVQLEANDQISSENSTLLVYVPLWERGAFSRSGINILGTMWNLRDHTGKENDFLK